VRYGRKEPFVPWPNKRSWRKGILEHAVSVKMIFALAAEDGSLKGGKKKLYEAKPMLLRELKFIFLGLKI
jgi:hypothetical protein